MLNPAFTAETQRAYGSRFALPETFAGVVGAANADFETGAELRTQYAYGEELWSRIRQLGLQEVNWDEAQILDACCGTGFLSYHLLARVHPRQLTMLDLSPHEVRAAKELIATRFGQAGDVRAVCGDLADAALAPEQFDIVVGNSFLHHFPDVPKALASTYRLLRPGGLFIGLHEPTPASSALESGQLRQVGAFYLIRRRYLSMIRHRGPAMMRPGATDIWVFELDDMRNLLSQAGFKEVRVVPRYLIRPFAVAVVNMHLTPSRPRLTPRRSALLTASVRLDAALTRLLPECVFGGLSFVGRKMA